MVIVVVDDEPDARELARLVLQRRGHEVHTARHPVAALRLLEEQQVDLVLTDLHMPRMDGRELARRVAEDHPDVTCIVWSHIGVDHDGEIPVRDKDVVRVAVDEWLGEVEGIEVVEVAEPLEEEA